jgi:hypothetical protein
MGPVLLVLWVLLADAWFQGPILGARLGLGASVPLALGLAGAGVFALARRWHRQALPDPGFAAVVAAVFVVATLVRLPALLAPFGLISSDSAVAGIIAQELRAGQLPAPIYAPGFPYEGTLKPHLTALLSLVLPSAGTPALYAWASHVFYALWIGCVMGLARGVSGTGAAAVAGLFMAVSPRFLTAFSVNNVGQYPEVNALGALALLLLARRSTTAPGAEPPPGLVTGPFRSPGLVACGFVLGLAVWQQLVGVYFVLVVAVAVAVTPELRAPRRLAEAAGGFWAGSYPLWAWNALHGWSTFDFFRRGGKNPADRLADLPERVERMLAVSFPKLFGLSDLGVAGAAALVLGGALPMLVLSMAWRRRREIRARRGRSPVFLAAVLLVVVIGVFAASKFSHRGAQRPRYLIPIYTSCAVALGWGVAGLWRRSRVLGGAAVLIVLGANAAGLHDWLRGRSPAQERDRAILRTLEDLGIRTGYAGFWVAPLQTFLSEGRVVLSGELGPTVSWVHAGHAAVVREAGPDAYIVDSGPLADALEARFAVLKCPVRRTDVGGLAIFHGLCRRVPLEEVEGYDNALSAPPGPEPPD